MFTRNRLEGFTLIELLIVMVIIGIMSLTVVIASVEATATANVRKVLSDLELVSKAVMMCYTDNFEKYSHAPNCDPPSIAEVRKYFANSSVIDDKGNDNSAASSSWAIEGQNKGKNNALEPPLWYIHYKMPQHMTDSYSFRKKLASHARKMRLFNSLEYRPDEAMKDTKKQRLYGATKAENNGKDPTDIWMIVMQ